MPLSCVAIDDEPLALSVIANYVARFPALKLLATFDDAISGAEFLRKTPVDLLFVDIQMPDILGTELVRAMPVKPMVIFTTAYKQFAHEGFELEALDYLLKPIDFTRFSRTVNKAIDYHAYKNASGKTEEQFLFVRSEYRLVKIDLAEILFIESMEDYCRINLVAGDPVLTLSPLKTLLEKLPEKEFMRIHRSFVVPLGKISSIVNRKVLLRSGKELPVGDRFIDEVQRRLRS